MHTNSGGNRFAFGISVEGERLRRRKIVLVDRGRVRQNLPTRIKECLLIERGRERSVGTVRARARSGARERERELCGFEDKMSSSNIPQQQLKKEDDEKSHSQEYVVYPRIDSGLTAPVANPAVQDYETGKWGTYTMGSPANPQAHPENQQAATWEPLSAAGGLERNGDEGSLQKAHSQTPTSSSTGYVNPPSPATSNPYISTTAAPTFTGKSPMDIISDYLSRWSKKFEQVAKKAEESAANIWTHMKTGPNMADTAWGRLSQGTKLLTEGGYEKIYRQTFETLPDEKLLKCYACYLSTSSGPVAGTLYISTQKISFCSDRPLSYQPTPGQTAWSYYKVVVPLDKLRAVNPSTSPNNPAEKYIQILTVDNHEFWFMGFVNYDKAVKNLQEALARRS